MYFRTLFSDVALYLSNVIVAGFVLIYHWYLMRTDSQVLQKVTFKVTLLGVSIPLGNLIFNELKKELSGYEITEINLDEDEFEESKFTSDISGADVIVIPTSILDHTVFGKVIKVLKSVSVFKIFIPQPDDSSHWLGAQLHEGKSLVKQLAKSIQSLFEGEKIRSRGTPGCLIIGSVLGAVFVVLILIVVILIFSGY